MTTEICLSQGRFAVVDDEDADAVRAYKWTLHSNPYSSVLYAKRSITRPGTTKKQSILLHTFLTGWPYVDHRNGDGLDNRRSNLRRATNAENQRNRSKPRHNTSGFKGVGWHRRWQRWRAYISIGGRQVSLGYHDTAEAAALAYDEAAREYFGEFACLNFPPPGERGA